jgi:hypothetical protein
MTLLERAAALEQNGTNDHVKHIGKQIKGWVQDVTAASMTKSEMRNRIPIDIGGYKNGQIIASILNIGDDEKSQLESLINDAKTFAAE